MNIIKITKTKKFDHIIGKEEEQEFLKTSDALDYCLKNFIEDDEAFEAIEELKEGEIFTENDDFYFNISIKEGF